MSGNGKPLRWLVSGRIGMAALLALGLFALDVLSPFQGAVAVLYTVVVLIVAREQQCGAGSGRDLRLFRDRGLLDQPWQ